MTRELLFFETFADGTRALLHRAGKVHMLTLGSAPPVEVSYFDGERRIIEARAEADARAHRRGGR